MMVGRLIEVGVAVSDLDAAARIFAERLGTRATAAIRAPMFSMDFRMCRLGDVDFELMRPYADESVVGRFIARRGEGLHHVAFHVPDIDETMRRLRSRGLPLTSREPVLLAGLRAAFLHPSCLSGLLVEFVENLHDWAYEPPAANDPWKGGAARVSGFGVAVKDLDNAARQYEAVLGAEISELCHDERLGADVRLAAVGNTQFELMPPVASRVAQGRLDADGQGLHHVCLHSGDTSSRALTADRANGSGVTEGRPYLTDPAACCGVMFDIRAASRGDIPRVARDAGGSDPALSQAGTKAS
jgi:methylmalonyl-CoA epimerase